METIENTVAEVKRGRKRSKFTRQVYVALKGDQWVVCGRGKPALNIQRRQVDIAWDSDLKPGDVFENVAV